MRKWVVEVYETVRQRSVYHIEADTQLEAEHIARTEEGEMEQIRYDIEERLVALILSSKPLDQ